MAGSMCSSARDYFETMGGLLGAIDYEAVEAVADALFEAWQSNRCVFVFGNGGSALTASHHLLDYVKTAAVDGQPRLHAISLVDNMGLITALSNDISYDETFRYPLESFARPGDMAVAISCSGNSPNVVSACQWAKQNGLTVVALTGFAGGAIGPIADIHINVPSDNYGIIEDLHLSIGHVVSQGLHARVSAVSKVRP